MPAVALTPAEIYARLEGLVLPTLVDYQADLTEVDRATLHDNTAPFLLSYRPTGTHLIVFGALKEFVDFSSAVSLTEQVRRTFIRKRAEVASPMQTCFVFFDGTDFVSLTRGQALHLTDQKLGEVLAQLDPSSKDRGGAPASWQPACK